MGRQVALYWISTNYQTQSSREHMHARLSTSLLCHSLTNGVINWHCHGIQGWVQLESGTVASSLCFTLLIPLIKCPFTLKSHPLIGTTLKIFHKVASMHNLSSYQVLCPLWQTTQPFPSGLLTFTYNTSLMANPFFLCLVLKKMPLKH